MESWLHDLRFAMASLRSSRWTALVAILTIGLGTGVNTAVLAVAYGVLLRPLPFADPARLAVVSTTAGTDYGVRLDAVPEWRTRLRTAETLGGFNASQFTLRGAGEPRTVRGALVTPEVFVILAVRPLWGEAFTSDAAATVAVSERLARQIAEQAGAGPSPGQALGRPISL